MKFCFVSMVIWRLSITNIGQHKIPCSSTMCHYNTLGWTGSSFLPEAISYHQYITTRILTVFEHLSDLDITYAFFIKAVHRLARQAFCGYLEPASSHRIINSQLWLPHLAGLIPCEFYMWGTLKNRVYSKNPRTKYGLKKDGVSSSLPPAGHEPYFRHLSLSLLAMATV